MFNVSNVFSVRHACSNLFYFHEDTIVVLNIKVKKCCYAYGNLGFGCLVFSLFTSDSEGFHIMIVRGHCLIL